MPATDYILVTDGSWAAPDGTLPPAGAGVGHILYDPEQPYAPPVGTSLVERTAFNGALYTPTPVVEVPDQVASWQLKAALLSVPSKVGSGGTALDDANAVAKAAGGVAALAWAGAATIARDSPTLAALAPSIGFKPADVDAAFLLANQTEA